MDDNEFVVGCANPYSLAEEIAGKRIDWSKEKDEFETLAKCFGITREGFLSNESPIESPYLGIDDEGKGYRLSDEEAEERVSSFLKKYERPESFIAAHAKGAKAGGTADRQKIKNVILRKTSSAPKPAPAVEKTPSTDRAPTGVLTPAPDGLPMIKKADLKKADPDGKLRELKEKADGGPAKTGSASPAASDDPQDDTDTYEWRDKGYFFNEVPLWSDVCQNSIGDCYFLASLCSVAYTNPLKIRNIAGFRATYGEGEKPDSPWHQVKYYVPSGSDRDYEMWKDKKKSTRTIVVSEEVLVSRSTGFSYGACGPRELQGTIPKSKADADSSWAGVYEKAFAKFLDRTESDKPNMKGRIDFGNPAMALKSILHTELVSTATLSFLSTDEIWKLCGKARTRPMTATISKSETKDSKGNIVQYSKAGTKQQYLDMGLHINHVYSVLDTITLEGTNYIVLRNPHGRNPNALRNNPCVYHRNWGFNYGVNAKPEYRSKVDIFKSLSGHDDPSSSNGLFLLELGEFKRVFDIITYYSGR